MLVPGDDTPDPELVRLSSAGAADCRRIWRYLREGGPDNARGRFCSFSARVSSRAAAILATPRAAAAGGDLPSERAALPTSTVGEREWRKGAPVAALLFYRAHLRGGKSVGVRRADRGARSPRG